jgi:hypothetical protein
VPILESITTLLQAGFGSLAAYLADHLLLCLLPALWQLAGRNECLGDCGYSGGIDRVAGAPEEPGYVETCSCPRCETTPNAKGNGEPFGTTSPLGEIA